MTMEELDKALETWQFIITHDGEHPLSKAMRELILQTIRLLWELKAKREA